MERVAKICQMQIAPNSAWRATKIAMFMSSRGFPAEICPPFRNAAPPFWVTFSELSATQAMSHTVREDCFFLFFSPRRVVYGGCIVAF